MEKINRIVEVFIICKTISTHDGKSHRCGIGRIDTDTFMDDVIPIVVFVGSAIFGFEPEIFLKPPI